MSLLKDIFNLSLTAPGVYADARRTEPSERETINALADAVKSHSDDWEYWCAAFLVALEKVRDVHEAIKVADEAVRDILPTKLSESQELLEAGPGKGYTGPWVDSLGRHQYYLNGRLIPGEDPLIHSFRNKERPGNFTGTIIDKHGKTFHFMHSRLMRVGHESDVELDHKLPLMRYDAKLDNAAAEHIAENPDVWKLPEPPPKPPDPPPAPPEGHGADIEPEARGFVKDVISYVEQYRAKDEETDALVDEYAKALGEYDSRQKDITGAEVKKRLLGAFNNAEWTINVSPNIQLNELVNPADKDVWNAGYLRVGEKIARDGTLRNQFETHVTMGMPVEYDPEYPANERTDAELKNFGIPLREQRWELRPKYGAVNWRNRNRGGAFYGSTVFVLNKDNLKDRITLTPGDSFGTYAESDATAANPTNALIRSGEALMGAFGWAGEGLPGYTELQVHGPLLINKDTIKEIRLAKGRDAPTEVTQRVNAAIMNMAKYYGIPVKFYNYYDGDDEGSTP